MAFTGSRTALIGLCAVVVSVGSCAHQDPRVLSPADVAAGCSETTPAPCEARCFKGSGTACGIFGEAVEGSADAAVRLPEDKPRGRRALDEGCRLGNLPSCRTLASYDTEATGVGADCAAWESVCRRGDQRSCTFFAECLDYDEHFRRDRAEALRLYEEGCARGERVACRQWARRWQRGDGVPRDLTKAVTLLDRACGMGDPLACGDEGFMIERGQGATRDVERVKTLYRIACARGIRPVPCEGLRRLGETPPSTVVSSADASESSFISRRFDYEWRLPANWELVPPSSLDLSDVPPSAEAAAARPRGGGSPDSLLISVTDEFMPAGGGEREAKTRTLDELEGLATTWLSAHGLKRTASVRKDFLYNDAVRVDAVVERPAKRFVAVTLFRKDKRQFELRCVTQRYQPEWPCVDAFGALMLHEPMRPETEFGRVLHLRDPTLGLSFDAPDDAWLAFGPRLEDRVSTWVWVEGGRRIDLSAIDVTGQPPETFPVVSAAMAEKYRSKGATVTTENTTLAGRPSVHHVIDWASDPPQDLFVQRRGNRVYVLVVSQPKRDPALLERVRAGLSHD
jgi:uncharacterized protein